MINCPEFTTKRLILKPRTSEHSNTLQKYFNNWNIIQHLNDSIPWPYPENGTQYHFKNDVKPRIKAKDCLMWVICEKHNPNHPIGLIEYRLNPYSAGTEDRGFWLAEPFWNKGYMSEAIKCLNDYIFFDVGIPKLRLSNHKNNVASRRVKEKTSAKFLKTETKLWRGENIEIELWELTAKNWKHYRENA